MALQLCGTCRHWGEPQDWSFIAALQSLRPCGAVKHDAKLPRKKDADGLDAEDPETFGPILDCPTPKAVVVDGSGYFAALKTAEDFGCPLWEAKS